MMKAVALLACVALASAARPELEYRNTFTSWTQTHQKVYSNEEFAQRYAAFKYNMDYVEKWNAEGHDSVLGMNQFADLTLSEFSARYLGLAYDHNADMLKSANYATIENAEAAPATQDWRTKGAVTAIKNQGQCGSCWSFSTTGSVEGAWQIKGNTLTPLSEQNLMDCSTAQGNQGCNGGLMDQAFTYIIKNQGIDTEASYPYTAADGKCHYNAANKGATISNYHDIPTTNETALMVAVGLVGPVSVAIDASHSSFQLYTSGVYYDLLCSSTKLDHGVLAVGYGTDSGKDYWIVKNSWGTTWGQQGYIWMSRNRHNNCGIATSASYPIV
eukprot:TRINITY_DN3323_c0_g1_i1.p1 TRINITY_DN3323_c0_g1~~TRINITY_DN3323_c0_g1_i1.p1  ORF type:complete len:329 (-),score=91.11 TRINITY_DN3323_c0_g1_i1:20-1006(-)